MSDIVDRLRRTAGFLTQTAGRENSRWVDEAADEIEILRLELKAARVALGGLKTAEAPITRDVGGPCT